MENQNNVSVKNNFFDQDGELSFYVKNTSQSDVMIADLGITIPMLGVTDLRERYDTERLKKSPGLREAFSPRVNWLKRITQEEFERLSMAQTKRQNRTEEQKRKLKERAETKALTGEDGNLKQVKVQINPKVQSMTEKLRLFYKGEDSPVTPEDFIQFVETTPLNSDERGYILGVVSDKEVRKAVNIKSDEEANKQ